MTRKKRCTIIIAAIIASWYILDRVHDHLAPKRNWKGEEDLEEKTWIASSKSFFDRGACRWLSLCGVSHIASDPAIRHRRKSRSEPFGTNPTSSDSAASQDAGSETFNEYSFKFEDSIKEGRILKDIPQFVLDHAPLVHLYSGERFWPSNPHTHLLRTTPHLNYTPISEFPSTLDNLDTLQDFDNGRFLFLKSNDNVEDRPGWLGGDGNITYSPEKANFGDWIDWDPEIDGPRPDDDRDAWYDIGIDSTKPLGGSRPDPNSNAKQPLPQESNPASKFHFELKKRNDKKFRRKLRLRSSASNAQQPQSPTPNPLTSPGSSSTSPAILILVQKSPEIIDAFWFYFYSFNLGPSVLNLRFGNHVGDWEHSLIRFQNGIPRAMFFSAHSGGQAYSFDAVEKIGQRPVIYSAEGTHAMYARPKEQKYGLPWGLLKDVTDRGPLWDPALNFWGYWYDYKKDGGGWSDRGSRGVENVGDDDNDTLEENRVGSNDFKGADLEVGKGKEKGKGRSKTNDDKNQIFKPTSQTPNVPTSWFWYQGHWGDKFYELSDERQYRVAGQYHYVNGPLGPRFKNLGRRRVCQGNGGCEILERA